jgi:ABC-type multidrug transport system permease subunit
MVERFSWPWFDRFWQIVALLICLAVFGFELFKVAADLPSAQR